jgi:hypothetical protein
MSAANDVTCDPMLMTRMHEILNTFREEGVELEVVVGTFRGGRFLAGIDFKDFFSVYEDLKTSCDSAPTLWTLVPSKTIHYHYANGFRRVVSQSSPVIYMQKTPIANILVELSGSKYVFRVHSKREISQRRLQVVVRPQMVRMIERWSFRHSSGVVYDLSKVSQGSDQEDACSRDPIFEFEMEFYKANESASIQQCHPSPASPSIQQESARGYAVDSGESLIGCSPMECRLSTRLLVERIVDISGRYTSERTMIPRIHASIHNSRH